MYTVSLNEFIKKMKVVNLTPEVDIENIEITQTDTNRPPCSWQIFLIILTTIVSRSSDRWNILIWKRSV